MSTPKDRFTRFLAYLDYLFGQEPEFYPVELMRSDTPKITLMVYRDVPEPGSITGVTYGLSEVDHPKWLAGRPELIISVDSTEFAWPHAIAQLVNKLRGQCPFCYGDVIDFADQIAPDSLMSAFFLFAPSIFAREDHTGIDVGGPLPINLIGAYPIYDSERAALAKMGLEKFWHHESFDLYNVNRQRVPAPVEPAVEAGTPNQTQQKMLENIAKFGCSVMHVAEDDDFPPFSYSIGITKTSNAPEVLVVGLKRELSHSIINQYNDRVRDGERFEPGRRYSEFIEGFDVEFAKVLPDHYDDYLGGNLWLYDGPDFETLQVVYPTTSGIWPWEAAASDWFKRRQPLLFAQRGRS